MVDTSRSISRKILPTAALGLFGFLLLGACDDVTVVTLPVEEVEISPAELTLAEGEQETLIATARSESGQVLSGREIQWSVDGPEVASVSAGGVVEALAEGETVVRARTDGVEGTASVSVLPGPSIGLSREAVELAAVSGDAEPAEGQVDVSNTQFGELSGLEVRIEGEGGDEASWLEADLSSTTAPATLDLRASAADLEAGTYRATVEVSSPVARDGPRSVSVTFQVAEPPPILVVDPESVGLSAITGSTTRASQTLSVQNAGGRVLGSLGVDVSYAPNQPTGWLDATLAATTAPTTLTVRASARDLSPGQYSATVVVSSPLAENESVSVAVTFTVQSR